MLADAEHAASTGDLVSAEKLLRSAAVRQEAELGPLHPDLANTLNNLAIVTEKTARLDDAEAFYRRAVAIVSRSLPPDDPTVAASRQNLEEFCRAHGLPIDGPATGEPVTRSTSPPPSSIPTTRPPAHPSTGPAADVSPPVAIVSAETRTAPPEQAIPSPAPIGSGKTPRGPVTIAIAVAVLLIVALLVTRPWSSRPAPSSPATPASAPATAEPAQPTPAPPVPTKQAAAAQQESVPATARGAGGVTLVTAEVCRHFSTSDWRCDPAGESVAPGALVLLSRVRSPADGIVVHRWYRGDALRKSAQLRIGANASEGYRTYSRQTVDRGDWRVEVRTAAGDLLYQQRFSVR